MLILRQWDSRETGGLNLCGNNRARALRGTFYYSDLLSLLIILLHIIIYEEVQKKKPLKGSIDEETLQRLGLAMVTGCEGCSHITL